MNVFSTPDFGNAAAFIGTHPRNQNLLRYARWTQSPLVNMSQWPVRRSAVVGITAQFLALVRILSEVFRLKYFDVAHYTLGELEPFIGAALFTAVLVPVAVATFALRRERIALAIAIFNVVALFVYKVAFM